MSGRSSSLRGSSTSPRSGSKRGSLTVFIDPVEVLQNKFKKKEAELAGLTEKKRMHQLGFLKAAGVSLLDPAAVIKALSANQDNPLLMNLVVDNAIATLSSELETIKKELAEQESVTTSHKKAAHSVAPSKLTPANIHQARGSVDVHDRDSGVARHAAFFAVLQSFSKTGWDAKKQLLTTNCPSFFDEMVDSTTTKSAADIDAQLGNLRGHIYEAQVANSGTATNILEKRKSVFSEELQFRLSRFCEKCALPIRFSHQYPTAISGSGEDKSDIACFSLDENDNRSLRGHIEVKRDDATDARWQLCGYAAETFHEKVFLSFCMTIDHQIIALYGFMQSTDPGNQKRTFVEHSLLCRAPRDSPDVVESLLGSYFLAVLLTSRKFDQMPGMVPGTAPCPYWFCPLYPKAKSIAPKVFQVTADSVDSVAKVFDYGPARSVKRQPNTDWWKTALPGTAISVLEVEDCENVSVLVTPFFPGGSIPTHPLHVALLCDQLSSLHTANKCHGDVLCQNVRFWVEGDEAKTALIDYDYSHFLSYPNFWNTEFPERHPEAKGGRKVLAVHDVYSAIAILCKHFKFGESHGHERKPMWEQFVTSDFEKKNDPYLLKSWTAKDVATWIRENKDHIVKDPGC
jgi:hypothetical protein